MEELKNASLAVYTFEAAIFGLHYIKKKRDNSSQPLFGPVMKYGDRAVDRSKVIKNKQKCPLLI